MKKFYSLYLMISFAGYLTAQLPEKNILLHTQNDKIENLLAIDYNNDGWTDYVSLAGTNGYFFQNNGGNTWSQKTVVPGFSDANLIKTMAIDFNSDGWTDIIAVRDITYTTVSYYKNPGNLTDPWVNQSIGPSMNFLIGIFDMDEDDDPDLIYENSGSYLYWSENEGGTITLSHAIPDDYPSVRVVSVFDFDKDGDQDWAAYFYDCCTDYFENNGDGTFSTSTVSTDENQDDIYVGDATGDGYADIIVEDAFNLGVSVFDTISGEFDLDIPWDFSTNILDIQQNDLDNDGDNDWVIFENDPLSSYTNMKWIQSNGLYVDLDDLELVQDSLPGNSKYLLLSDYNNDNYNDLIYEDNEQPLIALSEMPDAFFAQPFDPDTSYIRMDLMTSFDVDGDADNDLVVVSHDGKLAWFKYDNALDTFFAVHYLPNLDASPYPSMLQHHDIDMDGDEDLLASFHSAFGGLEISYYFLNDGNGIFTAYLIDSLAFDEVWLTDADSDGDEDLIAMEYGSPHNLYLYLRYPDPAGYYIYTTALTTGSWKAWEMMDADTDGDNDFIGAPSASSYIVELPNTDGFTFFGTQFNLFYAECTPAAIFINDFDLDGDEDIAYPCMYSGDFMMAVNTAGVFAPGAIGDFTIPAISDVNKNDEADLNGDGYPDIILSDYYFGTYIKLSNGAGSYDADNLLFSSDFGEFGNINNDSLIDFAGTNDFEFYTQKNILLSNPMFTLLPASATLLQENISTDGITITFDKIPAAELIIQVTPSGSIDAGAGEGMPVSVIFAPDSSSLMPKFISWHVPDDTIVEDIATSTVAITADPLTWGIYAGSVNENYSYTVTDNDIGLFYSIAGIATVNEGSVTVMAVHINAIPSATTYLDLIPQPDINLGVIAGATVTYTFNPDISSLTDKIFYISTPNDMYYEPNYFSSFTAEFISDDTLFDAFLPEEKIQSVHDNEIVDITRGGVGTYSYEEGEDNFTIPITITSEPYFDVYVIAMPDVQLDLGNGPGIADTVRFISDGITNTAKIFTGMPVDDIFVEGAHTGKITFEIISDDIYYDAVTMPYLTVKIQDNDELPNAVVEETGNIFRISPTLSNGDIHFENYALAGEILINITDITGRNVYSTAFNGTGDHLIKLDDLENGTYILLLQNAGNLYTQRIVIMK